MRLWRRSPLLCLTITLTLALGIAAAGIAFSVLEGTVLRRLPFKNSSRIVSVRSTEPKTGHPEDIPLGLVVRWKEASRSFESLGAYVDYRAFVSLGNHGTAVYPAADVTPGFFEALSTQPILGSGFGLAHPGEGSEQLALLGYRAWKRDFRSDPEVVGMQIEVNDQPTTIVGVLPKGFRFPSGQEIWVELPLAGSLSKRFAGLPVTPVGRLGNGISLEAAREELQSIMATYDRPGSPAVHKASLAVEPFVAALTDPRLRASVIPMILGMGAVLLLACANVSNLLLARGVTRRHAVAVRAVLGANRVEAAVTMVSEALALSLVGALAALPLTVLGVEAFNRFMTPSRILHASWVAVEVDLRVLGFIAIVAVGSGLLISVLPAIDRSTRYPGEALGTSTHPLGLGRLGFWNRSLLLFEMAMTAGILLIAGLLVKNVARLRTVDLGVAPSGVMSAKVSILPARGLDDAGAQQFFAELSKRIQALPGVDSAAYVSSLPTEGSFWREVSVRGRQKPVRIRWQVVSRRAFKTLGVQFLAGRDFSPLVPGRKPDEAIVNRSFARHFLKGRGLGAQLHLSASTSGENKLTVVGIVNDFLLEPPGEAPETPALFTSLSHDPRKSMELIVRGKASFPVPAKTLCREAIRTRSEAACFDVRTLPGVLSRRVWIYDALATLFAGLGVLALVLGATGAFGVMSFLASNSKQEIGLRFALGATRGSVERLVLRQFAIPALAGVAAGLAAGVACARLLSSLLRGVESWDPAILTLTAILLIAPSLLAVLGPAWRAAKVDPMSSLRLE